MHTAAITDQGTYSSAGVTGGGPVTPQPARRQGISPRRFGLIALAGIAAAAALAACGGSANLPAGAIPSNPASQLEAAAAQQAAAAAAQQAAAASAAGSQEGAAEEAGGAPSAEQTAEGTPAGSSQEVTANAIRQEAEHAAESAVEEAVGGGE